MDSLTYIFNTAREAYDACQCGDLPTGTCFYIPTEKIVGIAATWPVAVTVEHEGLHIPIGKLADLTHGGRGRGIMLEHIQRATRVAELLGLAARPP